MAISLTRAQAAELAWIYASPMGTESESHLLVPDVEALIDEAIRDLTDTIIKDGKYYILQDRFSGSLSTDTNTNLGAAVLDNSVIAETVKSSNGGQVRHPSYILPLTYLPNLEDLYLYHPGGLELAYYTVQGGSEASQGQAVVYAADYQGAPLSGSINITACRYPTFATLPPQLEDEFIETLADMAREKLLLARATTRLIGKAPFQAPTGTE